MREKFTPRQIVNLILAGLAAAVLVAVPMIPTIDDVPRAGIMGAAGGLLIGLITPGSPVDRVLDALLGARDERAAEVVADALRSRPGSVVAPAPRRLADRREDGSAALDVLGAIVAAAIGLGLLLTRVGH